MIRQLDRLVSLPATDVSRAVRFYAETLGCSTVIGVPERGFYIFGLPEGHSMLGIHRHEGPLPASDPMGVWLWLTVTDIAEVRAQLEPAGVRFLGERREMGPGFEQPFLDSEGNVLRFYEPIRELRKEVTIAAPADLVFAALTEPEQIERWFSRIDDVRLDARMGGAISFVDPAFGKVEGSITVWEPGRRLGFTFGANWPATLDFSLTETAGETRLEMVQAGFDPVRNRDYGIPPLMWAIRAWLDSIAKALGPVPA